MRQVAVGKTLLLVGLVAFAALAHAGGPAPRIVVRTQADLPNHSYRVDAPTASALLEGGPALDALATQVRADTEATLRNYDIQDRATLVRLYGQLSDLALLRGDTEPVTAYSQKLRALQDKPAAKLMTGIEQEAAAAALGAGDQVEARHAAYRKSLSQALAAMPWATVASEIKSRKGFADMPGRHTLIVGMTQAQLDPLVAAGTALNAETASLLLSARLFLLRLEPYAVDNAAVYGDAIRAHRADEPDIWPARAATLQAGEALTPVVVAIWDEGVDTALFEGRLFTNPAETMNGRDDDGNGFVDDVHGIGFDENDQPVSALMPSFDDHYPGREAELRVLAIGRGDAMADRDTPEAAIYRQRAAALKPEDVAPLMEAGQYYDSYYSHGTHVAGIAMDGNPAARLMVVRYSSSGYHTKPPAPTPEGQARAVANVKRIAAYLRAHQVRVVNMSFGEDVPSIAYTLEANGIGKDADERTAIATRIFAIDSAAYLDVIRSAPGILFVPAAGNSSSDVAFGGAIPADIDLPNVLTVGAVDHAGQEASFTSYGDRVRVYASGDEVDSLLPGGFHEKKSGTSMAAPQVVNLAAKLFAIDPSLTPEQVIALILDGATLSDDGKRRLIDPKHSVELLAQRRKP